MTEAEAVLVRHSVRNYLDKPIDAEKVRALCDLIEEINAEGNLHLQFIADAGKTFNRLLNRAMGLGSAPSVIACVGKDDETLDERVGYYGEKLVLAAQCMGLNTCWAGTFNRENIGADVKPGERLVIAIAIGYGKEQGKPRRSRTAEQVSSSAITPVPAWFENGVKFALLAPTAVNQQKFEITLDADGKASVRDKGGILSRIDLGIVRYHFELGTKQ